MPAKLGVVRLACVSAWFTATASERYGRAPQCPSGRRPWQSLGLVDVRLLAQGDARSDWVLVGPMGSGSSMRPLHDQASAEGSAPDPKP